MKNSRLHLLVLCLSATIIWSCNDDDDPIEPGPTNPVNTNEWLIDSDEVRDGGPGKDGIPSVDNPTFVTVAQSTYMTSEDLVLTLKVDGQRRTYTHPILDWHEIVNDKVGSTALSITYCPLTGTGTAWNRLISGGETTFGVSGLLYRNNLIPYDRTTDSNWSQIRLECVHGPLVGRKIETHPLVEMSWPTYNKMFPQSNVVLSTDTGINRPYGRYPYGTYKTNNDQLIFPVGRADDRLPAKERVLGVTVGGQTKVYQFSHFEDGPKLIFDAFAGVDLVIFGSKPDNVMVAYQVEVSTGRKPNFESVATLEEGGVIMTDDMSNQWDIYGTAVSGPDQGRQLLPVTMQMGYFFAFGAFFEEPAIH